MKMSQYLDTGEEQTIESFYKGKRIEKNGSIYINFLEYDTVKDSKGTIKIGGSGGTFPIQMTPDFFKAINSVIPFTYGIDACREAVGGIYLPNLMHDIYALLIFMIIPLIASILFKRSINRLGHPMN